MAKRAILLGPRFLAALKDLSATELTRVEEALKLLPDCFGQPHIHAGMSIRRFRRSIYECRAGLITRTLFRPHAQTLEVFFAGNHDEVRRLIRDL